jgi:hypothetical protein
MNRRSFLIGSGTILTAAFVDKANWFLRNKNAVVPFAEAEEAAQKLYFVDQGYGPYDLSLGTPDCAFPKLTYREWLAQYERFDLEKGKRISPESLERLWEDFGMVPDELELIAEPEFYEKEWNLAKSPLANAYNYLSDLDLFGAGGANDLKVGDLEFFAPYIPYSDIVYSDDHNGVQSEDPITASILQARLLELGQNVSVEIVDHF